MLKSSYFFILICSILFTSFYSISSLHASSITRIIFAMKTFKRWSVSSVSNSPTPMQCKGARKTFYFWIQVRQRGAGRQAAGGGGVEKSHALCITGVGCVLGFAQGGSSRACADPPPNQRSVGFGLAGTTLSCNLQQWNFTKSCQKQTRRERRSLRFARLRVDVDLEGRRSRTSTYRSSPRFAVRVTDRWEVSQLYSETCLTAAQDRKGKTPVAFLCIM
jgi:hypothetical protein